MGDRRDRDTSLGKRRPTRALRSVGPDTRGPLGDRGRLVHPLDRGVAQTLCQALRERLEGVVYRVRVGVDSVPLKRLGELERDREPCGAR